jgi:hypothetical protein
LVFLLAIAIAIILLVFVELLDTYRRGALFFVDLLIILIMISGTYAVFGGKRHLNIISVFLLFFIMMLGIDYGTNLPVMIFLGCLTLIYLELSDAAIRFHDHINKFHDMIVDHDTDGKLKFRIDKHMNKLTVQFFKNFFIILGITLVIISLAMMLFISYPDITPIFIHENLELQTVYAILPIFGLLFLFFMIYYMYSRSAQASKMEESEANKIESLWSSESTVNGR